MVKTAGAAIMAVLEWAGSWSSGSRAHRWTRCVEVCRIGRRVRNTTMPRTGQRRAGEDGRDQLRTKMYAVVEVLGHSRG